jgi:SPOR domain
MTIVVLREQFMLSSMGTPLNAVRKSVAFGTAIALLAACASNNSHPNADIALVPNVKLASIKIAFPNGLWPPVVTWDGLTVPIGPLTFGLATRGEIATPSAHRLRVVLNDSARQESSFFDVKQDQDLRILASGEFDGTSLADKGSPFLIIETSGLCSLQLVIGDNAISDTSVRDCARPSSTTYAIQLGAFPHEKSAQRWARELEAMGVTDLFVVLSKSVPSLCQNGQYLTLKGKFNSRKELQAESEHLALVYPRAVAQGTDAVTLSSDQSLRSKRCESR